MKYTSPSNEYLKRKKPTREKIKIQAKIVKRIVSDDHRSLKKSYKLCLRVPRKLITIKGRNKSAENAVSLIHIVTPKIRIETVASTAKRTLRILSCLLCTLQSVLNHLKYARKARQQISIE